MKKDNNMAKQSKPNQVEATAYVFKIVRANYHMKSDDLHKLIKQELPDISSDMIAAAYLYLYRKTK